MADLPLAPRRIFLVSFNKCGTRSFHQLFRFNGISACHHGSNDPASNLALNMFKNFMLARDPLTNIDGFSAYTDLAYYTKGMFYEGGRLYPYLHDYYPDSYFILATRDVEDWIGSRMAHANGGLTRRALSAVAGADRDGIADLWRQQFASHNAEVRGYFAARPTARFLEFALESGDPQRIADFLADDFAVDPSFWGKKGVTPEEQRQAATRPAR